MALTSRTRPSKSRVRPREAPALAGNRAVPLRLGGADRLIVNLATHRGVGRGAARLEWVRQAARATAQLSVAGLAGSPAILEDRWGAPGAAADRCRARRAALGRRAGRARRGAGPAAVRRALVARAGAERLGAGQPSPRRRDHRRGDGHRWATCSFYVGRSHRAWSWLKYTYCGSKPIKCLADDRARSRLPLPPARSSPVARTCWYSATE